MTNTLQQVGTFTARLGTAAGLITAGNWLFDYPFTGWAIWHFGSSVGGAIIIVLAPVLNYLIILWYRHTTTDWFGMEWLRTQEAIHSTDRSGRIIRAFLRKSRLLAFAALAVLADPTYAFIYQRGRMTGMRLTIRDWWWFALANVIGILPWIIGASIVVKAARSVFI